MNGRGRQGRGGGSAPRGGFRGGRGRLSSPGRGARGRGADTGYAFQNKAGVQGGVQKGRGRGGGPRRGRGRGGRGGRGGRFRGDVNRDGKKVTKEDLDKEMEAYFLKNAEKGKQKLDEDLDDYWKNKPEKTPKAEGDKEQE